MEKYGEIPPRFTRAWWEYFWEYYKWYVISAAFVIMLVSVWLYQCTHRPQYDMTIVYTGHKTYSEAEQAALCDIAAEYIGDADGNGESKIYFQPLVFSDSAGNEEYDYAIQTKLDLTFVDEDAYIYLMDEIEAALYTERDLSRDAFEDAEIFANGADVLRSEDGKAYAVSLRDSAILRDAGIYCDDLYVMVRLLSRDDDKNIKAHEGALAFARALAQ